MKYKITESDAATGITIEREANADEIADFKARESKIQNIKLTAELKATAKAAAQAKLAALGLTVEDLQALGL